MKIYQNVNQVQRARNAMKEALEKDEDLELAYVANVAMLLHDRYNITDYITRNQAAKDILNLIFGAKL